MKANELRIENYVNIEGDVVKVKEIYEKSIYYANGEYESYATEDFIHPIELTEEVLLKIGFENCNARYVDIYKIEKWIDESNFISIDYRDLRNGNTTLNITHINDGTYNQCTLLKNNIKYLHQLQNAYYLLANEELEVEL